MVDDKQLNRSANDKLAAEAKERKVVEDKKRLDMRRQRRIIQPPGFRNIITGQEDASGFGDVFNESAPVRVQKIAQYTWDAICRLGTTSVKEPWERMKLAKPEVLNAHMRYIEAYLKVGSSIERAVREVSNGRNGVEDLPKKSIEFHQILVPLIDQAKSLYT